MPSSSSQNPPEPRGLLHTLAAVFSGVLFGLFLSKFKTPPQQSMKGTTPSTETDDKNNSGQNFPPLPMQAPPTPSSSENLCKCCHHKMPWWKLELDVGMLLP